jgi:hypothetical protein
MAASFWLLLAPLLTGAFVGLLVAFLLEEDNPWRWFGLLVGAVVALLLRLRLATAGARARILSGHSPFGCFRAPRTPEEFADELCETWLATGRRPSVVGSGWGWFIARARARDAVYTHKLKGRTGEFTFLAGTELRTVEANIRKAHGRTFWSTPTMQRISIGSWLARSCHGNSGAAGKPSSYAAARVLVVDLTTLQAARAGPRWLDYATVKHEFDARPGQHAIAAVEFEPERMPKDFWLQKRRTDVTPDPFTASQGLREWLTAEAVLRVLFFGAARRGLAIGVTYVRFNPEEDAPDLRRECCGCCGRMIPHVDPHDCSAACMSMQLDTCSLVCGWYEKAKRSWRGIIKLSNANAFSPDPSWLGFPIISLLSGTVNFELIFVLPQLVAPTPRSQELRVQKLCNALFAVYRKVWGRSELRMGSLDKGLVFVDCVVRERDAATIVGAIKPHAHAGTVALHDAKFQGESVTRAIRAAGLVRKTPRVVFSMHY